MKLADQRSESETSFSCKKRQDKRRTNEKRSEEKYKKGYRAPQQSAAQDQVWREEETTEEEKRKGKKNGAEDQLVPLSVTQRRTVVLYVSIMTDCTHISRQVLKVQETSLFANCCDWDIMNVFLEMVVLDEQEAFLSPLIDNINGITVLSASERIPVNMHQTECLSVEFDLSEQNITTHDVHCLL